MEQIVLICSIFFYVGVNCIIRKNIISVHLDSRLYYNYIVRKWISRRWYALFYFLMMIPIQYLYLQGLHEKKKETELSQQELYEKISFGEEQLHFMCKATHFIYLLRLLHI